MCSEDKVNVLDDSLGTGALGELYFWVSGKFIDHHKQVFSIGQWSPKVHIDALPWAIWEFGWL